jgi:diguanylate cyclase (GGDEF)-like protein/PAS domain S-box-containing protein
LGFTVWYPATGLVFVLLIGINPKYLPLALLADFLAGQLFYHQEIDSWTQTLGSLGAVGSYAIAAYVLRGPLLIDFGLKRRLDVVRYVLVTMLAAAAATAIGVASLAADHTIQWNQYWNSAAGWFVGDVTALFGLSPFLLIHVLPIVSRGLLRIANPSLSAPHSRRRDRTGVLQVVEIIAQAISIPTILWLVFAGPFAARQYYYLVFLPVIWIAMRQGITRVVTALIVFNFGVVLMLRVFPPTGETVGKIGFLMLIVSGVGLLLGSTVSERQRTGQELGERTMYLDSLIENTPLGIVVNDQFGRAQLCNKALENLFAFSRERLIGNNIDSLIVPPERKKEALELSSLVASGQMVQTLTQRNRQDGLYLDVELHSVPLVRGRVVTGSLSIYTDVTERVRAAVQLEMQSEELRCSLTELEVRTLQATLLNEMGALLQSCETKNEAISVVEKYATRMFTLSTSGALCTFRASHNALERECHWGAPDDLETAFPANLCWALRTGRSYWSESANARLACKHVGNLGPSFHLCVPMIARGATSGILRLSYQPDAVNNVLNSMAGWRESQKLLAVSVATQVALSLASLKLGESLRDQSIRDPLTGLFNRRFMQESLDRELQRARRKSRSVALILLDIDHFKKFNDTFGHDAGDAVLRSFADLLRDFFRGEDVACRYGGEEFALILPESNESAAAARLEQFGDRVRKMAILHKGQTLDRVSVSAGVAAFPVHGADPESLLRRADQALYIAKAEGRDRITIADLPLIGAKPV